MKAMIYYRMSSDQQTDSIERQKSEVEPVVEREGDEVLTVFVDKGKSGSKHREKRLAFLRMMRDIERGTEAQKLYLWDLARFTRENPFKAAKFYELLMDREILIHDVKLGVIDLNTAPGRMIINMMQETNHAYSTTISQNTTSGRRRLLAQGWWVAGSIPYGYMRRYVGSGSEEVIRPRRDSGYQKPRGWRLALATHEEEAEIVRAIFSMYLREDTSFRAIARWLNANGIAPPSGDESKGWKGGTIKQVIGNRAYCGYTHIGGCHRRYRDSEVFARIGDDEVKSDKVPQIISESDWEKADAKRRCRKEQRYNPKPTQHGQLSGILYCGHCRYALDKVERSNKDKEPYVYYHCQSGCKYPSKFQCHQWRILEGEAVVMVMMRLFDAVEAKLRNIEVKQKPDTLSNGKAKRLQTKLAKLDAAISRANHRFLTTADSSHELEADFRRIVAGYQSDREEVEMELRSLHMNEEEKSKLVDEFIQLKATYTVTVTDGHPLVEAFRPMQRERLGDMNVIKTTISIPICSPDQLRPFLKMLGAKVYVHWKARALKNKRGNPRLDENGNLVRSIRNYEVDHARISAEFSPENVLTSRSSSCNHAGSHDRDSRCSGTRCQGYRSR